MIKKALFVFIFLSLSLYSFSSIQGTIKGTVKDKKGMPLEGVKVTVSSIQYSAVKYVLTTNQKGEFLQIGLQPDYYQIKAEKDGYLPAIIEKRVTMMIVTEVEIELEEGKYFIGKSPGEDDFMEGIRLFEEEKYREAAESFQKAAEKEPFEPIYFNNLGETFIKLEEYDQAIEAYTKMVEIQPESYTANKKLGELYGLKKEFEKAIPYFQKAAELSSEDPRAYFDLGACLMNLQDYSAALEAFNKAVTLDPKFAPPYYQLGLIYVNQNKNEEAIQSLEKFIELAPEDSKAEVARQLLSYLKSR